MSWAKPPARWLTSPSTIDLIRALGCDGVYCKNRPGPPRGFVWKRTKRRTASCHSNGPIDLSVHIFRYHVLAAHLDIQPYSGCQWHERWHWHCTFQAKPKGGGKRAGSHTVAFRNTPARRLIGRPVWLPKSKHGATARAALCRRLTKPKRTHRVLTVPLTQLKRPDRPGRECHTLAEATKGHK